MTRPCVHDTSFDNASRRPHYILPDSNIGIKSQNLLGLDATKIQAVVQGVFQQTSRTIAHALLSCFRRCRDGRLDRTFPNQRYAKLVRLSICAFAFRRELPDETATAVKTPIMVPSLPTDITSLAFHLRYL